MYGIDIPDCNAGSLEPSCNAASYIDSQILGVSHMYFPTNGGSWPNKEVTFQREKDCSTCYPGRCVPPPDAPEWCGYDSLKGGQAFDPEGLVSTITAVCASLFGALVGSVGVEFENKSASRITHWGALGLLSFACGVIAMVAGIPFNTDLYSISYMFLTNGVSLLALVIISLSIDPVIPHNNTIFAPCGFKMNLNDNDPGEEIDLLRSWQVNNIDRRNRDHKDLNYEEGFSCRWYIGHFPLLVAQPFMWVGLNSILIYLLSVTEILQWFFALFFWGTPHNSLADYLWPTGEWWGPESEDSYVPTRTEQSPDGSDEVLIWCIFAYIPFWMFFAGLLHYRRIYWKI
jgi:hypothetical protein